MKAETPLNEYDDGYLDCRDLRHHWKLFGFTRMPGGGVRRIVECSKCGTQRSDHWSLSGNRISSRYRYPAGYQLKGGGVTSTDVRREVLNRATIYNSESDLFTALEDR